MKGKMFLDKSDKEIKQECDELIARCLADEAVFTDASGPYPKLLQFEKAKLGIIELQNRKNSRVTYFSLGISILSLLVAIFAVFIAYKSNKSNDDRVSSQFIIIGRNQ